MNTNREERRMRDVRMEGEMMETETAMAMAMEQQPQVASNSNSNAAPGDSVRDLLTMARQLINQGKPSQALQAVILSLSFLSSFTSVFLWILSLLLSFQI